MSRSSSDEKKSAGLVERTATGLVSRLVDLGIDGKGPLDPAQQIADEARAKHGSTEDAVDAVLSSARRAAAAGGFVTGLGGFVTLPVALPANVVGFYVIATRAVAATAALRGFDLSKPEVRTAVLLVLTGSDASSVLGKVGLGGGGGIVTRLAAGRLSGTSLMVVQKAIGFRLVSQLGTGVLGKLGRGIPLAGGLIGAGSDVFLLGRIVKTAKKEFTEDQLRELSGR